MTSMIALRILYYLGLCGITLTAIHRLWFVFRSKRDRRTVSMPSLRAHPLVTVQIPVYNEKYVIERILDSIRSIQYPASKLEIQLLDDSTDETSSIIERCIQDLRQDGWDIAHIRRPHRQHFKAGALKNGLELARGEYIAIFDADFAIPPDFFERTLPHFQPEHVGCVQVRWGFFNAEENLLTQLQSILLDAHFSIEQKVRFDRDLFLTFNGTAGIWKKEAILRSGGWGKHSLTEDLDLSYRAQLSGWKIIYLDEITAQSQLPNNYPDFQRQQSRWAKGSMQSFKKLFWPVMTKGIPLRKKIEALLHLGRHFSYLFTFLVLMSMPWVVADRERSNPFNYMDAALFAFSTACVMLYFHQAFRLKAPPVKKIFLLFSACALGLSLTITMVVALFEGLLTTKGEFIRTPKFFHPKYRYSTALQKKDLWDVAFCTYFFVCIYKLFFSEFWISKPFLFLTMGALLIPSIMLAKSSFFRANQTTMGAP